MVEQRKTPKTNCHENVFARNGVEFYSAFSTTLRRIWEAGVKSFKFHLTRVLGEQALTFEEITTVATRIETILNSRPLTPMSSDPEDFDVLTPGHFLIGAPLLHLPEPDWYERGLHLRNRWDFLRKCISDLWARWRLDYFTELQNRLKWTDNIPNLTPGTLVLLKEPNAPVLSWPVGRVLDCIKSNDGIVRVVKLGTSLGEYVRPVTKLAPLFPHTEDSTRE